jgi:hypothetical protein
MRKLNNDVKYLSELITKEDLDTWEMGDLINIKASTGKGKSHFIITKMQDYVIENGGKILILTNRKRLFQQYNILIGNKWDEDGTLIEENSYIKIMTYQELQTRLLHWEDNIEFFDSFYNFYNFVICDEYHYWYTDSKFNKYTDISLEFILYLNSVVKILMSATPFGIDSYIESLGYKFDHTYISLNRYDMLDNYKTFASDKTITNEIYNILNTTNDKIIFFTQSIKEGHDLYKELGKDKAIFVCSKSNGTYKSSDEEEVDEMIKNERFEKRILITTSVLDNGVNLKDEQIKHVIVSMWDTDVIRQCIGRRRILNDKDSFTIYIKNHGNMAIGGKKGIALKYLEQVKILEEDGQTEYISQMKREVESTGLIYDSLENDKIVKKVNEIRKYKLLKDIKFYEDLDKLKDKNKFARHVWMLLPTNVEIIDMEKEDICDKLEVYLSENVGRIMLERKDREELIKMINVRDGNSGKLLKSIEVLNAKLNEINSFYIIKKFETSRMIDGKKKKYKSSWKLLKIVDAKN